MRLRTSLLLLFLSGCYVRYAPGPEYAPIPQDRAIGIAYQFAQSQGYHPTGVSYAVYRPARSFWKIRLFLGAPSCGSMRVDVGGYDGRVLMGTPYLHPCNGWHPGPEEEDDRSDL